MHRPTRRAVTRWLLPGLAVAAVTAVAAATALHLHVVDVGPQPPAAAPASSPMAAAGSADQFRYLSAQTSNSCGLQPAVVMSYSDGQRIQGSCCNPMDMAKYSKQVLGLRPYASISRVPQDPYDVPASLAKQLLEDDQAIHLAATEQAVYDQAMPMTDDKAPCCCHCWRWNMTEGLAKYLISQLSWQASEVAHVVDLVNGCGGAA